MIIQIFNYLGNQFFKIFNIAYCNSFLKKETTKKLSGD